MDWFYALPEYRQRIYVILIGAILLTLPCYCLGIVLLILAPAEPTPVPTPAGGGALLPTTSLPPTLTRLPTFTPAGTATSLPLASPILPQVARSTLTSNFHLDRDTERHGLASPPLWRIGGRPGAGTVSAA